MRIVEELLGSKARIRLLGKMLDSPHAFSVRELARMSGLPKSTVAKIVNGWEKTGLLHVELFGRLKTVRLNSDYVLVPAIRRLFGEQRAYVERILDIIRKDPVLHSKGILSVMVYGSLGRRNIGGTSDADVLIVTESELGEKHAVHKTWDRLHEKLPITPSVVLMTKKEVEKRIQQKDKFIQNVLVDGIVLKGRDWFDRTRRTLE